MTVHKLFYEFLGTLADLFDAENRSGGHDAALELRKLAAKSHTAMPPAHQLLPDVVRAALTTDPHPASGIILDILPVIDWYHPGLNDGRIAEDIARKMVCCELIGPDGMLFCERLRVGLFVQSGDLTYVSRTHKADETFIMLGGSAHWQSGDGAPTQKAAGDYIYHPPMVPHASVTTTSPFIAAWRWTGQISHDDYSTIT